MQSMTVINLKPAYMQTNHFWLITAAGPGADDDDDYDDDDDGDDEQEEEGMGP